VRARTTLPFALGAAAAVVASACGPTETRSARAPLPTATAPTSTPVVVAIVVDQLAAWIARERWPELPQTGGFARLLREGTYAVEARYAHGVTETAPGHATLYTGTVPREHGAWANIVLSPGKRTPILQDDATQLVGPEGVRPEPGASCAVLRVETVADRLRAKHRSAVIVSLSAKDRGAVFAAGRTPSAAYWYDAASGAIVTSTAYATGRVPGLSYVGRAARVWELGDPDWVKRHAATPDDQDGEGDYAGLGRVFPHALGTATKPATAYRATPFSDDDVLELAKGFVSTREPGPAPAKLFALSLSANDYVGHTFGPDSWEAWEQLRALDASLARFFDVLDARFGKDGWSAVLSADHGVVPMPEVGPIHAWCKPGAPPDRWQRPCVTGAPRVLPADLAKDLAAAVGADNVLGVSEPYVVLTDKARATPREARRPIDQGILAVLAKHPAVHQVFDVRDFPSPCPADDSLVALACRSYPPGAPGDFYVVTKPGSFFDPFVVIGKGTSHGTPWLYDRAVPIVVRAPGRAAAGRVIDAPVPVTAFTRALAELLGVAPPGAASVAPSLLAPK
jgi:hypothetical protein